MFTRHYDHWPERTPKRLSIPETTLLDNLAISARRYPNKCAIIYYDQEITYQQLYEEQKRVAGYLQHELGVKKGDRVLIYMQNSPQYVIAIHAILRAEAIAVPINPMMVTEEVKFPIEDSEATVAFVGQELFERVKPLLEITPLQHVILAAYSEYLPESCEYELPDVVKAPPIGKDPQHISWQEVLSYDQAPFAYKGEADDLAVLPYTSGTTGLPKGCKHTHKTVQANVMSGSHWGNGSPEAVALGGLPLFHVTGLVHCMFVPIHLGGTVVLMTRWNRDVAGRLIEKHECTNWTNISTMVVDFLANPNLSNYNLSSLLAVNGGGAALPKAVGEKLFEVTGLRYAEGYGLTETISTTHSNPIGKAKLQCLGIPSFDVDSRVVEPLTLQELGPGQEGELLVNGPQVFKGYWNRPEDTAQVFVELDGKTFFRTGDIVTYDEDGYFYIVDRVKRMINSSGFKVWPAEVESKMYAHPAVQQCCIISTPDARRGETVKAVIILNDGFESTTEQEIIDWAKEKMAAYKYPRVIEFTKALPVSGSGKILWRKLQDAELQKSKS
ncbi:long-chain fatty acid--CoA ligase [Bacillaceae bacterium JMAK1]|nr:long-chain fatty acid--CoA ligase [Bacillaceae bacterium JMAK1]